MIKLNRTSEYGLIALKHINRKYFSDPAGVTSAREVSDTYGLPFEITAKTLQRLKDGGLIQSAQGARGGYTLSRDLQLVTLAEFLELMEGPQSVVACASGDTSTTTKGSSPAKLSKSALSRAAKESKDCDCEYSRKCEIRGVMSDLNKKVFEFLSGIRLAELVSSPAKTDVSASSAQAPLGSVTWAAMGPSSGREGF